MLLFRRTNKK